MSRIHFRLCDPLTDRQLMADYLKRSVKSSIFLIMPVRKK